MKEDFFDRFYLRHLCYLRLIYCVGIHRIDPCVPENDVCIPALPTGRVLCLARPKTFASFCVPDKLSNIFYAAAMRLGF